MPITERVSNLDYFFLRNVWGTVRVLRVSAHRERDATKERLMINLRKRDEKRRSAGGSLILAIGLVFGLALLGCDDDASDDMEARSFKRDDSFVYGGVIVSVGF